MSKGMKASSPRSDHVEPRQTANDGTQIRPNPQLVALVSYACQQVAQRINGEEYADWLKWAAEWFNGARQPEACVAIAQECFARKNHMVFPTLGQLAWAAKEACYSTPTSPWLVIRYVADAMLAFGVHYPGPSALPLLTNTPANEIAGEGLPDDQGASVAVPDVTSVPSQLLASSQAGKED